MKIFIRFHRYVTYRLHEQEKIEVFWLAVVDVTCGTLRKPGPPVELEELRRFTGLRERLGGEVLNNLEDPLGVSLGANV